MNFFPPLYNDPVGIIDIPDFFTKDEINKILTQVNSLEFNPGIVGDKNIRTDQNIRRSKVKWIPMDNPSYSWIYEKLFNEIQMINSKVFRFKLKAAPEAIQYTEYSESYKGTYNWHIDIGSDHPSSHRKISLSVQLSDLDEYKGGNLEIMGGGGKHVAQKSKGTVSIFPSFLQHRVSPVTKGTRKSLVLWVGGCPFK